MFQVKTMTLQDLPFAVRITDEMGWGLAEEEFKFMMELEPQGCFVLFGDSKRVGLVTNVTFGRIAWLGNLIVKRNYRKRGAGSLLVRHSIKYLTSVNVKTIGLYAYLDKVPFYENLGFSLDSDFAVMEGRGFFSSSITRVRKAANQDIESILDYDKHCFGESRSKSLRPILLDSDNLCYVLVEGDRTFGYIVAKLYRGKVELGPMVCQNGYREIAIDLLKTILSKVKDLEVSVLVPRKEKSIMETLARASFTESFRVVRMFLGSSIPDKCVFLPESLERG